MYYACGGLDIFSKKSLIVVGFFDTFQKFSHGGGGSVASGVDMLSCMLFILFILANIPIWGSRRLHTYNDYGNDKP